MKLEYKGTFPLNSVQKKFTPNTDEVYEVTEEDGNYLLNTFKGLFKQVEKKDTSRFTREIIKKEEVKEVEPEVVETKPTPKKTTTRKTGTKKSETEK